jgi:hypothetical protein
MLENDDKIQLEKCYYNFYGTYILFNCVHIKFVTIYEFFFLLS